MACSYARNNNNHLGHTQTLADELVVGVVELQPTRNRNRSHCENDWFAGTDEHMTIACHQVAEGVARARRHACTAGQRRCGMQRRIARGVEAQPNARRGSCDKIVLDVVADDDDDYDAGDGRWIAMEVVMACYG